MDNFIIKDNIKILLNDKVEQYEELQTELAKNKKKNFILSGVSNAVAVITGIVVVAFAIYWVLYLMKFPYLPTINTTGKYVFTLITASSILLNTSKPDLFQKEIDEKYPVFDKLPTTFFDSYRIFKSDMLEVKALYENEGDMCNIEYTVAIENGDVAKFEIPYVATVMKTKLMSEPDFGNYKGILDLRADEPIYYINYNTYALGVH